MSNNNWNSITNPISGEKYSIFSSEGRTLLKQYLRLVKNYQNGGSTGQVGGDYFLDPNAQHIAGQAEVVGYKQVPHHPPYPEVSDATNTV